MDQMMVEAKILESVIESVQRTAKEEAYLNNAETTIEESKRNRKKRQFDDAPLLQTIESLKNMGLDNTEQYFKLLVERLQCNGKLVPGTVGKEPDVLVYSYAYADLQSWESSESYQLLLGAKKQFPDQYSIVEGGIIELVKSYYEEIDSSAETDIVILYDEEHRDLERELRDELDSYAVQVFDVTNVKTYSDQKLLFALNNATLMILLCKNSEVGEKNFRTRQFRDNDTSNDNSVLFVVDEAESERDCPLVSVTSENWRELVGEKVSVLINGALPREAYVKSLVKRESDIQQIIDSKPISPDNYKRLKEELKNQIDQLEDYGILYGGDLPCRYDVNDLEELDELYSHEAEYTKSNVERWLGKIRRDDKTIRAIMSNKNPRRFYERYIQLCKLIDAQQEHRDKLLQTITMDELKGRVRDIVIDRLELHAFRWKYQQEFKDTILEKEMRPFDKKFFECKALDCINPFKIDNHIENFAKFEACGIYLSAKDGLNYWTKRAFMYARYEKQYEQNIINSEIDRITEFSQSIDHFIRDYENPTFKPEVLRKQAADLIASINKFQDDHKLPLVKNEHIYQGYRGRKCFIKYTNEAALNRAVDEAIAKNQRFLEEKSRNSKNAISLIKERDARRNNGSSLREMAENVMVKFKTERDYLIKEDYLSQALQYYLRASDMGDRVSQYRIGENFEKGFGFKQDMESALLYYRLSAQNGYTRAQLKLAEYYRSKNLIPSALEWYKKATEHEKPDFDACMFLGNYYIKTDKELALEYYHLAKDNIPEGRSIYDESVCLAIGMDCYEKENYGEAAKWLDFVKNNQQVIMICGDCYFIDRQYQKAINKYNLIPIDNLPDERCIILANYLLGNKDYATAYKYYSKCKNAETDPQIKRSIGDCYLGEGKKDRAAEIYKECLALGDDALLKKKIADILFDDEKYAEAIGYYLQYSEEFMDQGVFERIGDCRLASDNKVEAIESYLKCYDSVTDANKAKTLADLFTEAEEMEAAMVCFEKYLKENNGITIPDAISAYVLKNDKTDVLSEWYSEYNCLLPDSSLLKLLADYHRNMGENEKALSYYESYSNSHTLEDKISIAFLIECYEKNESSEKVMLWSEKLGDIYRENRNDELAVACYEKCDVNNLSADKLELVADACYDKKDVDRALELLNLSYNKAQNPKAAHKIAYILWETDKHAEAIVWYETYVSKTDDADIARFIANYYYYESDNKFASVNWYEKSKDVEPPFDKEVLTYLVACCEGSNNISFMRYASNPLNRWRKELADILRDEGDTAKAVKLYEKCDLYNSSAESKEFIAEYYYSIGENDTGIDWYAKSYAISRNYRVAKKIADDLWNRDRKVEAIKWYEKYFISSGDPDIAKAIGDYLFAEHKWAEASNWYEKFGKCSYRFDEGVARNIISCYKKRRDEDAVCRWTEKLGDALLEKGDTDAAIREFIKCKNKLSKSRNQKLVADYYYNSDDPTNAILLYERYASSVYDKDVEKIIADFYYKNCIYRKALVWYEKLSSRQAITDAETMRNIIHCYNDARKKDKSAIWSEKLGDFLLDKEDKKGAIKAYNDCGKLLTNTDKQKLVADHFYGTGKKAKSIDWYERYASSTHDANIEKLIADYYFDNGNYDKAAVWYEILNGHNAITDEETISRVALCYKENENEDGEALWSEKLGDILISRGDNEGAIKAYVDCGRRLASSDKQKMIADYYYANGDLPKAITWYERYATDVVDTVIERLIADYYFDNEHYSDAVVWLMAFEGHSRAKKLEIIGRIVACYEAIGEQENLSIWAEKLGDLLVKKGEVDAAACEYGKCGKWLKDTKKQKLVADYYYNNGESKKAVVWYKRYAANVQDADVEKIIGDYYFDAGETYSAMSWYTLCSSHSKLPVADVLFRLADYYYSRRDKENAFSYYFSAAQAIDGIRANFGKMDVVENDRAVIINNNHLFLKQEGRLYHIASRMIDSCRVVGARMFNKGEIVVVLNENAPKELPCEFKIVDNLKRGVNFVNAFEGFASLRKLRVDNL